MFLCPLSVEQLLKRMTRLVTRSAFGDCRVLKIDGHLPQILCLLIGIVGELVLHSSQIHGFLIIWK